MACLTAIRQGSGPSPVLADQVRNLDWRARKAVRICAIPDEVVVQVLRRLHALLPPPTEQVQRVH